MQKNILACIPLCLLLVFASFCYWRGRSRVYFAQATIWGQICSGMFSSPYVQCSYYLLPLLLSFCSLSSVSCRTIVDEEINLISKNLSRFYGTHLVRHSRCLWTYGANPSIVQHWVPCLSVSRSPFGHGLLTICLRSLFVRLAVYGSAICSGQSYICFEADRGKCRLPLLNCVCFGSTGTALRIYWS